MHFPAEAELFGNKPAHADNCVCVLPRLVLCELWSVQHMLFMSRAQESQILSGQCFSQLYIEMSRLVRTIS